LSVPSEVHRPAELPSYGWGSSGISTPAQNFAGDKIHPAPASPIFREKDVLRLHSTALFSEVTVLPPAPRISAVKLFSPGISSKGHHHGGLDVAGKRRLQQRDADTRDPKFAR
jgi:hypothetical protein